MLFVRLPPSSLFPLLPNTLLFNAVELLTHYTSTHTVCVWVCRHHHHPSPSPICTHTTHTAISASIGKDFRGVGFSVGSSKCTREDRLQTHSLFVLYSTPPPPIKFSKVKNLKQTGNQTCQKKTCPSHIIPISWQRQKWWQRGVGTEWRLESRQTVSKERAWINNNQWKWKCVCVTAYRQVECKISIDRGDFKKRRQQREEKGKRLFDLCVCDLSSW